MHAEQDSLDATYFVVYHLKAIEKALDELEKYLARKQEELKTVDILLKGGLDLNHRQRALIRHAIDSPGFIYTFESHFLAPADLEARLSKDEDTRLDLKSAY